MGEPREVKILRNMPENANFRKRSDKNGPDYQTFQKRLN